MLARLYILLLLLLAWGGAGQAWASNIIVSSGGFESPSFTAGDNLVGQQGWLSAGAGQTSATVQDSVSLSGSQALRVDRAGNSDRRWAVPQTGVPTGRYVTIAWDMAVEVTQNPGVLGPFFGVDTYDASGSLGVLGSLGVDAASGEVLYQAAGTGFLTPAGPVVASNAWNHFEIELDFQTDTYGLLFNGDLLKTVGFVDGGLGLDTFTDADIAAFAGAGDAAAMSEAGHAYFDNFLVFDGLPGDFNGDGQVDAADYTVWRDSLGATGLTLAADANGDRLVDTGDYTIWKSHFGRSNQMSGSLVATHVVPEPSSFLFGGLACIGFIGMKVRNAAKAKKALGIVRK